MAHAAAANQLIDDGELARYLDITYADDADLDRIYQMINHASQWIETRLDRKFRAATALVERSDGNGRMRRYLRNAPATAITSIERFEGKTTGWVNVVTVHNWSFDSDLPLGMVWFNDGHSFTKGDENWRITYDYGWALSAVPSDLKLACCILTEHFNGLHNVQGKRSVRFAEESTTLARDGNRNTNIPSEALEILSAYRRY